MIDVRIQRGTAEDVFSDLRREWQRLYRDAAPAPFLSWEWMSSWFESFGNGRSPAIMTARQDGRVIGILPMMREKRFILGKYLECLSSVGAGVGGADYLDVIARPHDRAKCIAAFVDHLKTVDLDLVEFASLERGSATYDMLKILSQGQDPRFSRFSEKFDSVCPQIDLSLGWKNVLESSKRKVNFRRRLKALERESSFEFRSLRSLDEIDAAFERFMQLHERRWARAGGSELSGHPRLMGFHRRVVPRLAAAGLVRFDELWLDGECSSSVYGLDNGNTFYYYNSGYDPALSNRSVGLVLLGLSIRAACERGVKVFDLLRGDETYKFDWANRSNELTTISLSNRSLPIMLHDRVGSITTGLRSVARRALPSAIAEPLRNWRRSSRRKYQLSGQ